MPANETRGRRKIDPSEWPNLLARRQQGATQAEIAREYGVSQGTVSQILKRTREDFAQSAAAPPASGSAPANDDAGAAAGAAPSVAAVGAGADAAAPRPTLTVGGDSGRTGADARPDARAPSASTVHEPEAAKDFAGSREDTAGNGAPNPNPRAEAGPRTLGTNAAGAREPGQRRILTTSRSVSEDRAEPAAASGGRAEPAAPQPASKNTGGDGPPAESGSADLQETGNPLADRLRRAADHAAKLVDAGTGSGDQLGDAVHEVRRALAAIEIDAAKRQSAVTRSSAPEPEIDDNEQFGRIKFFKPEKGFGFIIPDDGGDDIFLSSKTASAAGLDNLTQGDRVRFIPGPGSKGLEAKSIERDD